MELTILNPENYRGGKTTKPSIRFSKQGAISISRTTRELLKLKPSDVVNFAFGKKAERELFIFKASNGFICRGKTEGLTFNSAKLAIEILEYAKVEDHVTSCTFLIYPEPTIHKDVQYWGINTLRPINPKP